MARVFIPQIVAPADERPDRVITVRISKSRYKALVQQAKHVSAVIGEPVSLNRLCVSKIVHAGEVEIIPRQKPTRRYDNSLTDEPNQKLAAKNGKREESSREEVPKVQSELQTGSQPPN